MSDDIKDTIVTMLSLSDSATISTCCSNNGTTWSLNCNSCALTDKNASPTCRMCFICINTFSREEECSNVLCRQCLILLYVSLGGNASDLIEYLL